MTAKDAATGSSSALNSESSDPKQGKKSAKPANGQSAKTVNDGAAPEVATKTADAPKKEAAKEQPKKSETRKDEPIKDKSKAEVAPAAPAPEPATSAPAPAKAPKTAKPKEESKTDAPAPVAAPAAAPETAQPAPAAEPKAKRERTRKGKEADVAAAAPAPAPAAAPAPEAPKQDRKRKTATEAAPAPAPAPAPVAEPAAEPKQRKARNTAAAPASAPAAAPPAPARAADDAGRRGGKNGTGQQDGQAAPRSSTTIAEVRATGPPPGVRVAGGIYSAGSSSRYGFRRSADGTFSDSIPVPSEMAEWAEGAEGTAFAQQTAVRTGVLSVKYQRLSASSGVFEVRGNDRESIRGAMAVVELHLDHEQLLLSYKQRAARYDSDLAAAQEELRAGLRTEFAVPQEVLGLVIGKQGANIARVQELTGVDRIVVDSESVPCMVRIRGPTCEATAEARRQLEYTVVEIPLTQQQIGWLVGAGGATINSIRDKSSVLRMQIEAAPDAEEPEPEPVAAPAGGKKRGAQVIASVSAPSGPRTAAHLIITGLRSHAEHARLLVEQRLEFQAKFLEAQHEEQALRERLAQLDVSYGDVPRSRVGAAAAAGGGMPASFPAYPGPAAGRTGGNRRRRADDA